MILSKQTKSNWITQRRALFGSLNSFSSLHCLGFALLRGACRWLLSHMPGYPVKLNLGSQTRFILELRLTSNSQKYSRCNFLMGLQSKSPDV